MQNSPNFIPLARLIILFCVLLAAGILLTVPLFKFDWRKFSKSSLFIKIIFWLPIFLIFLAVLYINSQAKLAVLVILLALSLREILSVAKNSQKQTLLYLYFVLFALGLSHLALIGTARPGQFIGLLITLALASVLADVTAFFFGNYLGIHKLPAALNKNKSWEGVGGQILGSLVGVLLVNAFIMPVVSIWLFLPIGVGAAVGDLANSYVKRKVDKKDWSGAIPGHGGFVDRLSSLAGSAALTFYFLKIIT